MSQIDDKIIQGFILRLQVLADSTLVFGHQVLMPELILLHKTLKTSYKQREGFHHIVMITHSIAN